MGLQRRGEGGRFNVNSDPQLHLAGVCGLAVSLVAASGSSCVAWSFTLLLKPREVVQRHVECALRVLRVEEASC